MALILGIATLALAVACGGGDDGGNGGNGGGSNGTPRPAPSGGNAVNIVITDTTFTIDQAEVANGVVAFTVRNDGTKAHSLYLVSWDKPIEELPIDADNQVDVLLSGLKIPPGGQMQNLAPGSSKTQNIAVVPGTLVLFSNEPGDFTGGLRATLKVN